MVSRQDYSSGERSSDAQRLLETWERLGRAHVMIGAGCSCGVAGVVVALEDFEQDIVDYLQAEAERLNRDDVIKYLEGHGREGGLWSVLKLLADLDRGIDPAIEEPGVGAFLLERLSRTLQSFEKLHGSA